MPGPPRGCGLWGLWRKAGQSSGVMASSIIDSTYIALSGSSSVTAVTLECDVLVAAYSDVYHGAEVCTGLTLASDGWDSILRFSEEDGYGVRY